MARIARRTGVALALGALLAAAALPLADIESTAPIADEFVVGYDARRLLDGEVPYRDFHAIEPPGAIGLHAALYLVAGRSHLASRLLAGAIAGATTTIALLLLAALLPPFPPRGQQAGVLAGALAAGLCPFLLWPYPTAHGPAALATLASLLVLSPPAPSKRRLAASGALVATAGLFHPVFGVAAAAGASVAVVAGHRRRSVPAFAAGLLAVAALAAVPFAASGSLGAAVRSLLWPVFHYHQSGGGNQVVTGAGIASGLRQAQVAGGAVGMLAFAVLSVAVLLAIMASPIVLARVALAATRRSRPTAAVDPPLASALSVAALVLTGLELYQRPDLVHLAFAGSLLLPALSALSAPVPRPFRLAGRLLAAAAAASSIALLASRDLRAPSLLPRFDALARDWAEMKALRDLSSEGDRIAVLPAGGFYYCYTRRDATGFSWLLPPGSRYHDESDYARAAAALTRNRARLVWFTSPEAQRDFLEHAGALSQILRRDYHGVTTGSGFRVLVQNAE